MGIKSKFFGFVAAAALTLSMSVGIASAQPAPDNKVVGQAELSGSSMCTLVVTQATPNFGVWNWTGSLYTLSSPGSNISSIQMAITTGQPGQTCDLEIKNNGLFFDTGNPFSQDSSNIPFSNFDARISGGQWESVVGTTHTFAGQSTSNPTVRLKLTDVPNNKPGTYIGTFGFTISANNP